MNLSSLVRHYSKKNIILSKILCIKLYMFRKYIEIILTIKNFLYLQSKHLMKIDCTVFVTF